MATTVARKKTVRNIVVLLVVGGLAFASARINYAQNGGLDGGTAPVITDQFNSVTSSALQARAPGNQIRRSQNVTVDDFDTEPFEDDQEFVADTIELLLLQLLDEISQILSGLSLVTGGNPLSGLLGGNGGLFGNLTGGNGSIPII